MTKLQVMFATAVIGMMMSAGPAHATVINIILGNTSSDISFNAGTTASSTNIDLASQGSNLVFNKNAEVTNAPSVVGQYIRPSGSLYGGTYLAVRGFPANGSPEIGMATVNLQPGNNVFGFTWGTVDPYNTLMLIDSRNVTYTVTGSDILSLIANSAAGTTQSDVTFTDAFGSIARAQFISIQQNAFEAANFSATDSSAVPLPSSWLLFGGALIGLMILARLRMDRQNEMADL